MPLHVHNPGFEKEELEQLVMAIVNEMIDKVPESALPALVTKKMVRSITRDIAHNLTAEQLVDLAFFAHGRLDTLFGNMAGDWMREKAGAGATEYQMTRKALAERGIALF